MLFLLHNVRNEVDINCMYETAGVCDVSDITRTSTTSLAQGTLCYHIHVSRLATYTCACTFSDGRVKLCF